MRASWLFVPILGLALVGCDGLFGPWKKENPSCTGTDCTTPPTCTPGEPGCTVVEDMSVLEPCTASACSSAGCWDTLCIPALRSHVPTAMWINTVGKVYLTTQGGKILTVTQPEGAAMVREEGLPTVGGQTSLNGIFGYDDTYLWAVGSDGKVRHRVGAANWTEMNSGLPMPLLDVSATHHQRVWASVSDGKLVLFDGDRWEINATAASTPLHGVWATPEGDAVAVGANGTIVKYVSTGPMTMSVAGNPTTRLNDVFGTSKTDIWVAGGESTSDGVVLHYDGASWAAVPIEPGPGLLSVWGNGSDVWFVGHGGRILHARGAQVLPEASPTDKKLVAVFGCPATGVFAVAENGVLLHRRPN